MQTRYASSPKEVAAMNTEELRENFLMESLMQARQVTALFGQWRAKIIRLQTWILWKLKI